MNNENKRQNEKQRGEKLKKNLKTNNNNKKMKLLRDDRNFSW